MKKQIVFGIVAATAATSIFATANQVQAAVFTGPTSMDKVISGTNNEFHAYGTMSFYDFFYASAAGALPMDPKNVTISEYSIGGKRGILMNGAFFSNSIDGDIALGYTLESLDPKVFFTGAEMRINGISSGVIRVTEDITSGPDVIASFIAEGSPGNPGFAKANFTMPVQMLSVIKDIELRAEGNPDQFSILIQLYENNVPTPEPSHLIGLASIGMLGLLAGKKRKA